MAKKESTPSFVHELPLRVDPHAERVLSVRFDAARQLYNACLREALRRLDLMRESRAWQKARACKDKKERSALYRQAAEPFDLNEYSLHAFAAQTKNACWIGDHLDAQACQKVATCAYKAAEEHLYGTRGRPRFKRFGWMFSVEGKSNSCGIRWREDRVLWLGLELPALFDPKDKHGVQAHALSCRVKYVRLVRRKIRGQQRWIVQLVLEGQPLWKEKNAIGEGYSGIDVGPSTIAMVGDQGAALTAFADAGEPLGDQLRLIQRAMDRSRRATNPDNFNENGTAKKGRRRWVKSRRYRLLQEQAAEIQRKLAATRKIAHGRLAHQVIALGKNINAEKLSYRALQKCFGRSVGRRAPGMFVALLRRKALNAGGALNEFSTRETRFSQLCLCGCLEKKPLRQRWHACGCGIGPVQRDLFSAFLAQQLQGDSLDILQAQAAWTGAKPLLDRAVSRLNQTANGEARLSSFGLGRRQSCSHGKERLPHAEARNAVGRKPESPREVGGLPLEPPGFIHGEV